MPRHRIRTHYEQLSEFERGHIIGLKKAGWANRRIARHMGRSDGHRTSGGRIDCQIRCHSTQLIFINHQTCNPLMSVHHDLSQMAGRVKFTLVTIATPPATHACILSSQITEVLGSISCQVIYSQLGLAIHQNDHQARRRFVEWAQNEIAVVPDFHKRILFSDEAHFWLNGYVNKQNCRIWSEANPQVYVKTPLYPVKLTVWCALWAGGILLQKRCRPQRYSQW
ncbi:putative transposable element [Trichonephila clavipes]|nr:putative transposable element [Trichonephila clavipes]